MFRLSIDNKTVITSQSYRDIIEFLQETFDLTDLPCPVKFTNTSNTTFRGILEKNTDTHYKLSYIVDQEDSPNTYEAFTSIIPKKEIKLISRLSPIELTSYNDFLINALSLNFSTKHKRIQPWRADIYARYFYINSEVEVVAEREDCHRVDEGRYQSGNYFATKEQADRIRNKYFELLTK